MSSVWELSTDGIVTILIVAVIGGLAIAWLFAGRSKAQPVSSLEQMRLGGREADVAAPLSPAAPAASPVTAPIATPAPRPATATATATATVISPAAAAAPAATAGLPPVELPPVEEAKPSPLGAPFLAPPTTTPQQAAPPKPEKPKPKSAEHASAMSIAAALVRNDKAGPAEATRQRPPALKAPRGGHADDLTLIKGVGARLEGQLNEMGYHHFDQIAAWTEAETAWIDQNLSGFTGRATQDQWVAQARALANGGPADAPRRLNGLG